MKRKFFLLTKDAFQKSNSKNLKEFWEKKKSEGYEGLSITLKTVLTKQSENKFHAVFSTDSEDRHGDVVVQEWDLKSFKKNPVFLDSHNYDSIEHILGRIDPIGAKTGSLEGDIEFALDNPKGMLAMKLADGGFLNATSVGFIPKEFDESDFTKILKSELLEVSAVSVPANPEALFGKSNEPNDDEDAEDAPADEPAAAGNGDGGEGTGAGGQPGTQPDAGGEQGGNPDEPEAEPGQGSVMEDPKEDSAGTKAARAVSSLLEEAAKVKNRKLFLLKCAARVIDALGEKKMVETPAKRDRAEEKRIINGAVRKLIKEKIN